MAELSIAIADDNRQTLNLLGEILEKEDGIHVVGKADNGEDAYNMIAATVNCAAGTTVTNPVTQTHVTAVNSASI